MNHPAIERETPGAVLVIGGGVGGMRAAIDLAEAGLKVYLVESSPALGGRVAQLGFMFPTHDCVLCRGTADHGYGCTRPSITPALMDHNRHPNIEVLTLTDVVRCEGEAGDFAVTLRQRAQFVDPARCINCGRCAEVCPVERPSGFQMGLSQRKAISKSAPRAVPDAYYLLAPTGACAACQRCVAVCPTGAVDLTAEPRLHQVRVGAVIVAVGYTLANPRSLQEYGYGRFPNVVTTMQYERMASRSGPTEGVVGRPSDGRPPKRIAWLQCIGSRDQYYPYCSAICCMVATKEAMLARQRLPDTQAHIFTMDERAFNKEYNAYYHQAREQFGIAYTRCRVPEIHEDRDTHELIVRYVPDDAAEGGPRRVEERFDMIVLAVGMRPPANATHLADVLGFELNEYGFCLTDKFSPLETSRPGVFVCGAFASPKEIAETLIDASGAAAEAMRLMHDRLGRAPSSREHPFISGGEPAPGLPAERAVAGEAPRIGVFVCQCGGSIAGVIDTEAVAGYAAGRPGVVQATTLPLACFADGLRDIRHAIAELGLSRVVVGACSHRTHEALFQRTLREAGLNPYLVEVVNLREQCAWVHAGDPAGATRKACELMRLGIERVRRAAPVHKEARAPARSALVIGGGAAGMSAALAIADSGYHVDMVEKTGALGGNLHHIYFVAEGANPQRLLRDLVNRVVGHEHITLHLRSEVVEHTGSVGAFRSTLRTRSPNRLVETKRLAHGVTVVATGARETHTARYGLGADPRVMTLSELESVLVHQPERLARLKQAVMIQCVRPEGLPDYCSRTCCTSTMKCALRLKQLNPGCQVTVLYKDIITYGFREKFYREARAAGVLFVRYTADDPPVMHAGGGALRLSARDHVLGLTLELQPDLLCLSMSIAAGADTAELAATLAVPLSSEGFFMEAHLKMRPMDFTGEGVFLAGMAHYPKFIEETIANGLAAAGRALTVLSKDTLYLGGAVAVVDAAKCTGCLTCARTCPFGIPQIRPDQTGVGGLPGAAWLDPARCQGCGTCTAECPAGAIQLRHYHDDQIRCGLGAWEVSRDAWARPVAGPATAKGVGA